MNLLLLMAHSIAEYDDMRMFVDLGYDVFAPGAYTDPAAPGDDKRPALPQAPRHPDLIALCSDTMAAKEHLPDALIDWADVIICHHYPEKFLVAQWQRIRHKRVIWRTCGQSDPRLEGVMAGLRRHGLEIVRYSPREREFFGSIGAWAGQDEMIRFGKYVDDYGPWIGDEKYVANVTQDMLGRGEHVGLGFWQAATAGLRVAPAGPGSEKMPGGRGSLSYPEMLSYLRHAGAYLYTGTVPASYTLGLLEAMLSGVPTLSIGPRAWAGPDQLFEGAELCGGFGSRGFDDPREAYAHLDAVLSDQGLARMMSDRQRARTREIFDVVAVGRRWLAYLGAPAELGALARPAAGAAV